jgi:hypothetical protein
MKKERYLTKQIKQNKKMKKVFVFSVLALGSLTSIAQKSVPTKDVKVVVDKMKDEKYLTIMKGHITKMNLAETTEAMDAVGNGFERIAEAETTEWLPRYYAAYCKLSGAFMAKDVKENDNRINEAEKLITAAENIQQNSELNCLKGMAHQARLMVDPMSRWKEFGAKADEAFNVATEFDQTNPRPMYLKAMAIMNTPEQFGGGKKVAKKMFEAALVKFTNFKLANELMPNWGMETTKAMITLCDK